MNWVDQSGITPEALAVLCGVSVRTVYRWKEGKYPRADRFGAIEAATGKRIQELIPQIFDPTK